MKILFVGNDKESLYNVAKRLQSIDDNYNIAPTFTTELTMKGHITENFIYYMPLEEVELAYKNNAFFWVCSNKMYSTGMTLQDYYDNEILILDFYAVSSVAEPIMKMLYRDGVVIVHIDSKKKKYTNEDIIESKFALSRLDPSITLYFCDDLPSVIVSKLLEYINGTDAQRKEIVNSLN